MTPRILLYGATGYSGRLIATEAAQRNNKFELVLGSRDARALANIGKRTKFDFTAFSLDDRQTVLRALRGFDVVINAAGPFAQTGEPLAKSAIESGCHYVDINGEVQVYKQLDDLNASAKRREVTLVCGAGLTATVSDVMLDRALGLVKQSNNKSINGGAIRIAVSQPAYFSRGSALTMLRSVREQVTVVRASIDPKTGSQVSPLRLTHVPVGKLERTFDFTMRDDSDSNLRSSRFGRRIASATNLLDTLTAKHTANRHELCPEIIESYVAMPSPLRLGYQLGALSAFMFSLPGVQRLYRTQIAQFSEGPTDVERAGNRQRIVLEIQDKYRETLIDWRVETPDPYDFTARSVLAVAEKLAVRSPNNHGWLTPAAVICGSLANYSLSKLPLFEGCKFESKSTGFQNP